MQDEEQASSLIAQIRGVVQGLFRSQPNDPTSLALRNGEPLKPDDYAKLGDLQPKLWEVNKLTNSQFELTLNEQHFVSQDRPLMTHLLVEGGLNIRQKLTHTGPDGVKIEYQHGVPQAVYKPDGSLKVALLRKDAEGQVRTPTCFARSLSCLLGLLLTWDAQ